MNHIPEQPRPPSLEDLLRLKRAERPDADFWQDFERGLRQKQLAAIVEPKPWWLGLSILLGKIPATGWAASAVSAGAAAVFAIMAITAPTTTSTSPREFAQQDQAPATTPPAPLTIAATPLVTPDNAPSVTTAPSLTGTVTTSAPALFNSESAPVVASASAASPATTDDIEPATLPANATILLASADARALVANDSLTLQAPLSFLDQAEARLGRLTTPLLEFVASGFSPTPAMITGFAPTTTLALAPAAAESEAPAAPTAISPRHARLLNAGIAYEADEKDLSQARDRVVHRLSTSEELYASVTRLGVRGDRLSVSF